MDCLLKVTDVRKTYLRRTSYFEPKKWVEAVGGVGFEIGKGETLGLVGESGSGKSTLGRLTLRLEKADSGSILFRERDLLTISESEMRQLRSRLQIIFQDPFASLNPRRTVREILQEPLCLFSKVESAKQREEKVTEMLHMVGLRDDALERYPHEFSGGQKQRIGIARAVILKPEFIVCDEPVSALDVSIQAQILNLLRDLQEKFGFSYLFISHDLRVIRHMCHRLLVMYKGKIVEKGTCEGIFQSPQCDYTKTLLGSVPRL